ncbi:MAG: O-antigen ligase family protein [Deltaproteobacteria bacterium]|nr:O-antigen ligase family protein [Deltaproteobacteria bacterium]
MRGGKNLPREFETGRAVRWLRGAIISMTALFPFVILPGIERPFSTPKIILLGGFVVLAGILALSTGNFRWPTLPRGFLLSLIAWPSTLIISALFGKFVSLETLWLALFSLGWFVLVMALRPKSMHLAMAVTASCTVIAAIALLQYLGFDPFRLFGWATPAYGSPRMRVLGTLGNPNFVAAFLVAGIPLTIHLGKLLKSRALYYLAITLQVAAVFATGSRAAIVALIGALVWIGALGQFARWRLMTAVALTVLLLLPWMPSRSLMNTLEGRFYIWRVTASHLLERPVFGYGPGAFEPKFIEWETAHWLDGLGTSDERKFSGLQAHAHNDYLETIVDSGFAAILSLGFLLGSFFTSAFQIERDASGDLPTGASAGVVALAAVAMVDFPFHRPAELFLLWTLMAIVFLPTGPELAGSPSTSAGRKAGRTAQGIH